MTSSPVMSRVLSTSSAQMSFAQNLPARLSNQTVQLYLDALGGSKRKFQAVQKLPSDCDLDRRLRSISNSWSGCSARRPAMLPIPHVCEA